MPSWRSGHRKRLEERSHRELVVWMLAGPIVGGLVLAMVVSNAFEHGLEFSLLDWLFQVVWVGAIGLGVALAIPATAWGEIWRRRHLQAADPAAAKPKPVNRGWD